MHPAVQMSPECRAGEGSPQRRLVAKSSAAPSTAPTPCSSPTWDVGRPVEAGDRVDYWSVTHQQWMRGVVLRVREGGAVCDLDFKRGAPVSRLRVVDDSGRNGNLFDTLDRDHDGVISRSEFEHGVKSGVVELGAGADLRAEDLASERSVLALAPAPAVVQAPISPTSSVNQAVAATCLANAGVGIGESDAQQAGRLWDRTPRAGRSRPNPPITTLPTLGQSTPVASSCQATPRNRVASGETSRLAIAADAAQSLAGIAGGWEVARPKQATPRSKAVSVDAARVADVADAGHAAASGAGWELARPKEVLSNEWAELVSMGMVSKAGSAAMRKMVVTTKTLLHGLEDSLIMRSGQLARAFYMWRCELLLARLADEHQDELAHLDSHMTKVQCGFEDQLRILREQAVAHRERLRVKNMQLVGKWVQGESRDFLHIVFQALHHQVKKKVILRSVHSAVHQLADGRDIGLAVACFQNWQNLAVKVSELRVKEQELHLICEQRLEEQQMAQEAEMQERLRAVQRQHRDKVREVEVLVIQWEKGQRKGMVAMAFNEWRLLSREQASRYRRIDAVQRHLTCWTESMDKSNLHHCYLHWKVRSIQASATRQLETASEESERLNILLSDQRKQHRALLDQQKSAADCRHEQAKAVVRSVVLRWELADTVGLLTSAVHAWSAIAKSMKEAARHRQAVLGVMMRTFDGDRRRVLHVAWLSWGALTKLEQQVQAEEDISKQCGRWAKFLQESPRECGAAARGVGRSASATALRAKAHAVAERMLRHWLGDGRRVMLATTLLAWSQVARMSCGADRAKQAAKSVVHRFAEGESLGFMQVILLTWRSWCHARSEVNAYQCKVAQLEEQRANLQGELSGSFQQMDLITQTLQRELRTKEEMATELRTAYSKMWRHSASSGRMVTTPTTTGSPAHDAPEPEQLSPVGSDRTVDLTTRVAFGSHPQD